jgi:hypothetical protein
VVELKVKLTAKSLLKQNILSLKLSNMPLQHFNLFILALSVSRRGEPVALLAIGKHLIAAVLRRDGLRIEWFNL